MKQSGLWNAAQYMKFGGLRTRPALELLNRIGEEDPGHVVDLGCGPGNSTELLCARWPNSRIDGVDNAPDMLARAQETGLKVNWVEEDIAQYARTEPVNVLYSNAALHWIDDHSELFPNLLGAIKSGGWIAVQMPRNFQEPSHVLMRETARTEPFNELLMGVLREDPVGNPSFYYSLMFSHCSQLDIWETIYTQELEGENPVLEWVKGTALVPVRNALSDYMFEQFTLIYAEKLRQAYPMQKNGKTLFPFRRLFIVGQKY